MNKTIVNIERISGCFPKLNIAKSGFYNFESGAFNHSATLPYKCSEDSMRCVSDKYIVRAFASGASSFAMPAGRNQALISSQPVLFVSAQTFFSSRRVPGKCRIDLPWTLTLPK
jgi:hypothetical protein